MKKMRMMFAVALIVVVLQAPRAGAEVKDDCVFDEHESSEAVKEGKAKIASLIGHSYTSYQTLEEGSYMYTVGICSNIGTIPNTKAAVIRQRMENGKALEASVIGVLDMAHIMSGTDWAVLEYKGSKDDYGAQCPESDKRTVIMIQCDHSVEDSKAEMALMKGTSEEDNCYYLFEMRHSGVCPGYSSSSGLSVGSILVIVFVSVAIVYLLVGFLYSRFVLGSKGLEQLPNYEFWKDFGNLQADGCDFVCRSKGRPPRGLGGLGDDQLDQPIEEIRDDNLLPM